MAMTNKKLEVVNAIIAHLGNISEANDYNFNLNDIIHSGEPNREEVNSGRPEIGLLSFVEESRLNAPCNYRKTLAVEIVGVTPGSVQFDNLTTDALMLEADIEKSLTDDPTLGAVVEFIAVGPTTTTLFKESSHARVLMNFTAHYLINEGSP